MWLLFYLRKCSGRHLKKTQGEYGVILPEEAYQYVREFGAETYARLRVKPVHEHHWPYAYLSGCRIPLPVAEMNHKRLEKLDIPLHKALLVWRPGRGDGYENIYKVHFAGDHILQGLLCAMTEDIYRDIQNVFEEADQSY